jgi:2-aminoadipate transaminase
MRTIMSTRDVTPFPLASWTRAIDDWLAVEARGHDLDLAGRADLIPLGLGFPAPELFPAQELQAAAARLLVGGSLALQYSTPPRRLVEHVVALMAARGVVCTADQIVLTNGAQQAMSMLAQVLVDPGQAVVVEEVSFPGMRWAASTRGAELLTVPVDLDRGMDLDALESLLVGGARPALIYAMGAGHNPTGVTLAASARERLVELARRFRTPVLEDDAYGFLQYEEAQPAILALDRDWVLYVGSFSKILAPGLRVGWIVAPPALARRLAFVKSAANLETATFAQHLVAEYLDHADMPGRIEALCREYRRRRDTMLAALAAHMPARARYTRPTGGMFVWIELPAGTDTYAVLDRSLREHQVMFFPGHSSAASPQRPSGHCLRLCFSNASPAQIAEGVARLGKLLRELLG